MSRKKRFRLFSTGGDTPAGEDSGPRGPRSQSEGASRARIDVAIATGVPVGKVVPFMLNGERTLVVLNDPTSPAAERFRRLRLKLETGLRDDGAKRQVYVVTSPSPEEGKTMTAANLALALAEEKDQAVLLIDGDLRRPSMNRYLTPKPKVGLSDVLIGRVTLDQALVRFENSALAYLPAGTATGSPLQLLQGEFLAKAFFEIRGAFDRVVVDTPPTVPFTDAAVLQALSDGALLVVRAGKTARSLVDKALDSLANGPLVGVVLNDIHFTAVDRYYYRYDEYAHYEAYGRAVDGGE